MLGNLQKYFPPFRIPSNRGFLPHKESFQHLSVTSTFSYHVSHDRVTKASKSLLVSTQYLKIVHPSFSSLEASFATTHFNQFLS